MSDRNEIELSTIVAVVRRWWWLIVLLTLLGAMTAFAVTRWMPPVYKASATLLISPAENSSASQLNDLMASERLALTYSQMLKDRPVLSVVKSKLNLKQSLGQLESSITTESIRDTQLIRLTVSNSDPAQAALIANTVADVFKARIESLAAERYAAAIKIAQERVDSFQSQVDSSETQMENLRSQKVEKDVALTNQQLVLDTLQKNNQSLQNNQQQMELTIAEATGNVYVFEPVQLSKEQGQEVTTAAAVISVGSTKAASGANLTQTYTRLIKNQTVLGGIIKDLHLSENPDQLAQKIGLEQVENTLLVRLSFRDPDESKASSVGQAVVNAFVTQVKNLLAEPYADRLASIQTQLNATDQSILAAQTEIGKLTTETSQLEAEISRMDTILSENRSDFREAQKNLEDMRITATRSSDSVVISEPAQAPKSPSQNNQLYIGLAGLVGLAIGVIAAFLLELLGGKIRTGQDVRKEFDLPTLGTVGRFHGSASELVMSSQPASPPADDFRVLSAHIRRLYEKQGVKKLLITSPTPMEGKSVIVSNLALALAKIGLDVIAVDADMRIPRLHSIFSLDQEGGLVNSLSEGTINGCLQNTQLPGLKVLTSGGTPPNPAELLSSPNLPKLIDQLAETVDIVLIDTPPVLSAADASIIAPAVDGVLLVLRAGYSESRTTQMTVEALRQVKANVVGVVLNAVPDRNEGYYRYYRKARSMR